MRHIRFRAKYIDDDSWAYGYYEQIPVGIGKPRGMMHTFNDWNLNGHFEVDSSTVGEWTGLRDVNKKEIYEGDIVAFPEHYSGDYKHKAGEGTIVFEEAAFEIDVMTNGLVSLCYNEGVEVVGNIYDKREQK